jgi:hypothetical protein
MKRKVILSMRQVIILLKSLLQVLGLMYQVLSIGVRNLRSLLDEALFCGFHGS